MHQHHEQSRKNDRELSQRVDVIPYVVMESRRNCSFSYHQLHYFDLQNYREDQKGQRFESSLVTLMVT
jgi:hypothetical protein